MIADQHCDLAHMTLLHLEMVQVMLTLHMQDGTSVLATIRQRYTNPLMATFSWSR